MGPPAAPGRSGSWIGIGLGSGFGEDFERGWQQRDATAAAAKSKEAEDLAKKAQNEKAAAEAKEAEARGEKADEPKEAELLSDEYYEAQKAKRRGLGLVRFIGELFKFSMLTEKIMHLCIQKMLSNATTPEEEEIESLCKLLTTVGKLLDEGKAEITSMFTLNDGEDAAKDGEDVEGEDEDDEDEVDDEDQAEETELSEEDAKRKIDNDIKEFLEVKDISEGELAMQGLKDHIEYLDDISIDVPSAYSFMAILLVSSGLSKDKIESLASTIQGEGLKPPKDRLMAKVEELL
ncbi:hypothetical protein L7F22_019789 [Adiantum nelumboides]|nr:hypothetical protein [Adiantum nelumboides]